MLRLIPFACAVAFALSIVADPLTPPTRPTTQKSSPKQIVKTLKGSVRMAIPADWTETGRSDDGKTLTFTSPDEVAIVSVQVVPQEFPIPEKNLGFREKIKAALLRDIKAAVENQGQELLFGPRSETDDRFYQRIHTRAKSGDETYDNLNLFRAAGLDLLVVNCIVKTDDQKIAFQYHTIGEDIALSITVGAAEKEKK